MVQNLIKERKINKIIIKMQDFLKMTLTKGKMKPYQLKIIKKLQKKISFLKIIIFKRKNWLKINKLLRIKS